MTYNLINLFHVPTPAARAWRTLAEALDDVDGTVVCATSPKVFFEALTPQRAQAAKDACSTCPARVPCLRYALAADERFGIWGGTTPAERFTALARAEAA